MNIFKSLPQDRTTEVFETLLQSKNIKIERIISHGQRSAAGEVYDQEQAEWVMVLQGAALVSIVGGATHQLVAGDYLHIPARQQHRVEWTDPASETLWLAIHYTPD